MQAGSAHARGAAAVAFGAALIFYALLGSLSPVWPSSEPATAAGLELTDVISQVPFGNRVHRAPIVAKLIASTVAGLIAWIIVRQGHPFTVAVGCALVFSFAPSVWRQAAGDAPGGIAALLVACAIAIACFSRASPIARVIASGVAVSTAASLEPAVLAAGPLIVAKAAGLSRMMVALAGVPGVVGAWIIPGAVPQPIGEAAMLLVGREWLLPGTALMAAAVIAPLWGAVWTPAASIPGTFISGALALAGHDTAALAPFPAMLMAHGLGTLAGLRPSGRGVVAIVLAIIAAADRANTPAPDAWRLFAWRDAIERVVPPGTQILTSTRAIAALNGALFAARPSGIALVYVGRDARLTGAGPAFVVDDLREFVAAAGQRPEAVPLNFASPADMISRLPEGTIVGLAVSELAAAQESERVSEALSALGLTPLDGPAHAMSVVGIAGRPAASEAADRRAAVHVLLGDVIDQTGQRSPTDFELQATAERASIRLRGRDLVAGNAWAAIVVEADGPLVDAFATDDGRDPWRLQVAGLNLWRVVAASREISQTP